MKLYAQHGYGEAEKINQACGIISAYSAKHNADRLNNRLSEIAHPHRPARIFDPGICR